MKKNLFCALALLGLSMASHAQLVLNENFTSYNAGNLSGQGSWTTVANNPDVQVVAPTSNALIYSNYTSGTKYITTGNSGGKDPYKNFSSSVNASANPTIYYSFVVRVANNSATTSTSLALQTIALRTNSGNNLGYFYIADGNNGNNVRFGISKSEDNTGQGTFSNNNYSFNTTYLIVIRYDVDVSNPAGAITASDNDEMYLWVNPGTLTQPSISSAIVTLSDGVDEGYSTNDIISGLQVYQQYSNSFGTIRFSAAASFDAFKVAFASGQGNAAANAAAAWNDLSAAGTPLPVRFSDFKAAQNGNAVLLNWKNATEENVVSYTIERSTDGINYTAIKEITPTKNNNGEVSYQYSDNTPLSGNNYYRIKAVETNGKISYTKINKISLGGLSVGLNIYPNPIKNKTLGLELTNLPKGKYSFKIISSAGQVINQESVEHNGGSFSQSMQLIKAKSGVYFLSVNGPVSLQKQFVVE